MDVLVVGAGPTGLMLANQLGRRGVAVRIIDRHSGPAQESRALGVQARTLEIYAHLGIDRRAIELGRPGTGANLWANGRRMARVPLGEAGRLVTPYPYILILGQDDNEHLLGELLPRWNLAVEWNTELVALEPSEDRVAATLARPDGSRERVEAAWVAGCDGTRSAVRELNHIGYPGGAYEHVFFVADTTVRGNMVAGEVNIYLWRSGFHLFFPMRGENHWRIVGILPPDLSDREARFDDVVPSLRGEAGADLRFEGCSWFSTYRIHHRRAARFRDRRCFLLGDAAHTHSPVGAQGMNTGLQDAYNLGWKLALVTQGRAGAALLDTYEEERVPVAQRLLATTDRAFRVVVSDHPLAGLLRTEVLARIGAFAMSREWVQAAAFRVVSQTDIHYRQSRLSRSLEGIPANAPRAGDRFPWMHLDGEDLFRRLDDTRFHLLVFDRENGEVDSDPLLTVHRFAASSANDRELDRLRIPQRSFYLLRPDGHVGICGERLDRGVVSQYLRDTIGLTR